MDGRPIVQIRADIDAFDADLRKPGAEPAGQIHAETAGRRFRVAAPEEEHIRVFGDVGIKVRLGGHLTHGLAPPDVFRAPEPAFPGVHVPHLKGIASHEAQEPVRTAVAGCCVLPFPVHIRLTENSLAAIGILHALKLIRGDLGSFVPGDADIAADAPVLRVALPLRVPIHPLQGPAHPVAGIDPRAVSQAEGGDGHPVRRRKAAAFGFHFPGIAVRFRIFRVVEIWPDPGDAPVCGIHHARAAAFRPHQAEAANTALVRFKSILHTQDFPFRRCSFASKHAKPLILCILFQIIISQFGRQVNQNPFRQASANHAVLPSLRP